MKRVLKLEYIQEMSESAYCTCSAMKHRFGYVDTRALCTPSMSTFRLCPFKEQFVFEICIHNTPWCNKNIKTCEQIRECFLDYSPECEQYADCIDYEFIKEWIEEE